MAVEQQEPLKGRILVVDDEEPVGRLLQEWLTDEGYHVVQALGFDDVQQLMQRELFDLVTLDIMMPDVDGLQVLRWIKAHYPEVGVVMATALSNLDTVLEALRAGASNYLLKPFNLELVSEEIARAMEQQRLLAENRSYQVELEQKVAVQTHALQHAYARQQQHIKELEGRDQLVHCQMSGPTLPQAYEEILQVVEQVLAIQQAVMYRPPWRTGRTRRPYRRSRWMRRGRWWRRCSATCSPSTGPAARPLFPSSTKRRYWVFSGSMVYQKRTRKRPETPYGGWGRKRPWSCGVRGWPRSWPVGRSKSMSY